jgi:predicted metal-binding protein
MKKIGIIICGRYQTCGGGKCFRALEERVGGFSVYADEEDVRIVGYSTCGGCPGGNGNMFPRR